jgi:serine/threonine protein kinase
VEGTPFGRYRLVEVLGRGGMGEVWRAFDTETQRVIALKVLAEHLASDPQFEQRFRREAFAAAGLANPHVVPIHNFGEIDGRLYVDMRLIDGRDLQAILEDGPLTPGRAVGIVGQVASALHAAHRIGLVHRDVKPSNILVDEEDFAYLIDFGIARAVGESKLTATGNVIGTWAYMAPERLTSGQTDPRADIYALTCVLHECLTGSQPFPGNSVEQQITAHLTLPPPRPSVLCDTVPTAIDAVIAKGMAKNSGERYATTREMANAARAAITVPMNQSRLPTEPARYVDHETEHAAQPPMPPIHHAATIAGVSPSAPTRYRPGSDPHVYPPTPGIPGGVLPPKPKRTYRTAIAIAGAIGVVATLIGVGAVFLFKGGQHGHSSHPTATGTGTSLPNTGPFTGTYTADFGAPTNFDGKPEEGGKPGTGRWHIRSMCRSAGCVATATATGGPTSSSFVFDDVGGRWIAVRVTSGTCRNSATEEWEVITLQPRPDGTLSGDYTIADTEACNAKRTVTYTRTGDVAVNSLADPANQAPRVASPAEALQGRYHYTQVVLNAANLEVDYAVGTDCLRTGDSCISFFHNTDLVLPLVFANGRWTRNQQYDSLCPGDGSPHVTERANFPLPQPQQNPITLLSGNGHREAATASPCVFGDFTAKFVRTGD